MSASSSDDRDSQRLAIAASFGERLRQLRTEIFGRRGQKKFARHVSIPQSSLGKYEKGVSPSVDALRRIVEATAVNANWLLTGQGQMFADPTAAPAASTEAGIEFLGRVSGDRFNANGIEPTTLYGRAPVGVCNPRFFSLAIEGDAMEPELLDGDLLIFYRLPALDTRADTTTHIARLQSFHGSIMLVQHNSHGMIRRLMVDAAQRSVMLVARSPRVMPLLIQDAQGAPGLSPTEVRFEGALRTIVRSAPDYSPANHNDDEESSTTTRRR